MSDGDTSPPQLEQAWHWEQVSVQGSEGQVENPPSCMGVWNCPYLLCCILATNPRATPSPAPAPWCGSVQTLDELSRAVLRMAP